MAGHGPGLPGTGCDSRYIGFGWSRERVIRQINDLIEEVDYLKHRLDKLERKQNTIKVEDLGRIH